MKTQNNIIMYSIKTNKREKQNKNIHVYKKVCAMGCKSMFAKENPSISVNHGHEFFSDKVTYSAIQSVNHKNVEVPKSKSALEINLQKS
jgi:hypothetical protein